MNIILSIKPRFVEKIKEGEKKFEFRKSLPKRKISQILIYSSSPVKKIVGKFDFEEVLELSPEELWKKCKSGAGIDESEFFKYFEGKEIAYGIKISNLNLYRRDIDPNEIDRNFVAPQSFKYTSINHSYLENIVAD